MNGSDAAGKIDAFPTPSFFSTGGTSTTSRLSVPDISGIFPPILTVVFVIWVIYTLVLAYHWFRYGHRSIVAIPMLVLHVVVSGTLMLLAVAGLK
jgi:hypothetical protein